MTHRWTITLPALLAAALCAGPAAAQDDPATTPAAQEAPAPEASPEPTPEPEEPAAVTFLRAVEAANADLKTLRGEFVQTRVNRMFLEEIRSEGEFWYAKPNRFRCDYRTPTLARFYLLGNEGLYYTPELNQLEKFRFESEGGEAPINQMLVGFGLETDLILDVFAVTEAAGQPADEGLYTLEFASKDLARSMDFRRIEVTFDRESLQPRRLVMEEEEDTVEVELRVVEPNAPIDDAQFQRDFPANVEIIEY